MENILKSHRDGFTCRRLFPVAAVGFLLSGGIAFAAQTITYSDGDNNAAAVDTTAPADPMTLGVATGSAEQSGVVSGTGDVIKQGDGELILSAANTYTGQTILRNGTLSVTGSITHPAADLWVGQLSGEDGTLEISGTGAVSNSYGYIGYQPGSTGLAKVSGGSWTNSSSLQVGDYGDGTLEISGTGAVSSTIGYIGKNVDSTGIAKVSGGSWMNSGKLQVGMYSDGTLEISGGLVTAASVTLANSGDSTGYVTLSGGTLATGQVSAGTGTGGGTFEFDGGTLQLTADQAYLFSGFDAGDVTLAAGGGTIDTQASTVASSYELSGAGGLTKDGAGSLTLSGANTYTGMTVVRNGTLGVTGSIAHPEAALWVGQQSGEDGTLEISGGLVTAESVTLANAGDSTGSVTLSGGALATGQVSEGAGTGGGTFEFDEGTLQLTADQADLFGGFDAGDVTLAAGGGTIDTQAFTVASGAALSGAGGLAKDGAGDLTLSGVNTYIGETIVRNGTLGVTGSITHPAADLWVGQQSGEDGTLEISGTGAVSNGVGYIGVHPASTGIAKVSGGSWTNAGNLVVGSSGAGTLEISGTGAVSSNFGYIGTNAGSTGIAKVSGGSWMNSGKLYVGFGGDSTLEISGTGALSNDIGNIGYASGSTGIAKVSGGSWMNSSQLYVGYHGDGTLEISGGLVTAESVTLTVGGDSTGSVALSGGALATGQVSEGAGPGGGTFEFDGGTLQLTADQADLFSGFETGDVTLAAGGGTIDSQAFTVASSYELSGAGGLTKDGAGSLTLSGTNTYTGATSVNSGALVIEGSLTDTAVTVASSAILGGSGTISGNVTVQSGGTLAPGSSPGILTVGSLDLQSGSITSMEINGLTPGTEHDQIVVNGNASLDGSLNLTYGYAPSDGDSFTLIDADSITGDFSQINNILNNAIVFNVTITDDYIFEIIATQSDFVNFVIDNPELMEIATVIDNNIEDAGLVPLVNELNLLTGEALPLAFQQINPQELTALAHFTAANARSNSMRLKNRQREVRHGATGFSTTGFNLYDETGQYIQQSLLADNSGSIPAGTKSQGLSSESKLSSYISGSGTMRDFDGDSSGPGYQDDSFAVLLGADYRLADNLALGAYLGYNHTNADLGGDGGNAELDSYRLGLTGTHWNPLSDGSGGIQRSYYTTAYAGLARHDYATDRKALSGTAKGNTDAFQFDLGSAIGYEVDYGDFVLTTELSLDYANLDTDGFTEKGSAAPLAIADDRSESLYSTLSVRMDFSYRIADMDVLPYAQIGWRHEFMDDSNSVAARFAASPGVGGFTVEGPKAARDSLVGGLGMTVLLDEGLSASLGYFGEFNPDFQSHSLNGSINLAF
jgi:T5SS/PEP-CTERM-associated repeat protein/autotransporter-associated beta strand protein